MDTRTGEIGTVAELKASGSEVEDLIGIDMDDATPKQRREKRVSPHDHRSKLGRQLTAARSKNQRKRDRRRARQRYGK